MISDLASTIMNTTQSGMSLTINSNVPISTMGNPKRTKKKLAKFQPN